MMWDWNRWIQNIEDVNTEVLAKAQARWNSIAKPLHGLGKLEEMIARIAAIQGSVIPTLKKRAILVMCADNGVVCEGVSQTGKEVTAIVTRNFTRGETSVNKMADVVHAKIFPVDIGVDADLQTEASDLGNIPLFHRKIARGTKNFLIEDAMTSDEVLYAIKIGIDLVKICKDEGIHLIGTGEMGIGNTTTAAAITAVLLDVSVEEVTGKGAGLSSMGLQRKMQVITNGIQNRRPNPTRPLEVLQKLGGLDIAGLVGVFLGGAMYKVPIILDGMITAVAALLAKRLCPMASKYMLASHLSKEPASRYILNELGLHPIIDGNLCLGEGTGACLLLGMLDTAMCVYENCTTFEDIAVEHYVEME